MVEIRGGHILTAFVYDGVSQFNKIRMYCSPPEVTLNNLRSRAGLLLHL